MRRTVFLLAALLGFGNMMEGVAQGVKNIIPDVSVSHFKMDRNGKYLTVEMNIGLTGLDVDANRAV